MYINFKVTLTICRYDLKHCYMPLALGNNFNIYLLA